MPNSDAKSKATPRVIQPRAFNDLRTIRVEGFSLNSVIKAVSRAVDKEKSMRPGAKITPEDIDTLIQPDVKITLEDKNTLISIRRRASGKGTLVIDIDVDRKTPLPEGSPYIVGGNAAIAIAQKIASRLHKITKTDWEYLNRPI